MKSQMNTSPTLLELKPQLPDYQYFIEIMMKII